jgi:hypothetical protein
MIAGSKLLSPCHENGPKIGKTNNHTKSAARPNLDLLFQL